MVGCIHWSGIAKEQIKRKLQIMRYLENNMKGRLKENKTW